MSSTNKTENLLLNSWIGSDKPERVDFNYDNEVIDRAITQHNQNTEVHINEEEREKWNTYMYCETFYGNGSESRSIKTKCPFSARLGFIFADESPVSIVRFDQKNQHSYFGVFSPLVSSLGLKLEEDGVTLTVTHSSLPVIVNEYVNFNEIGLQYRIVMFR